MHTHEGAVARCQARRRWAARIVSSASQLELGAALPPTRPRAERASTLTRSPGAPDAGAVSSPSLRHVIAVAFGRGGGAMIAGRGAGVLARSCQRGRWWRLPRGAFAASGALILRGLPSSASRAVFTRRIARAHLSACACSAAAGTASSLSSNSRASADLGVGAAAMPPHGCSLRSRGRARRASD
jgi:hypothetical protein